MVGDSAHDGNTAVNAGTRLVLVGWGYSSRSALDAFRVPVCAAAGELSARLHDESSLPFPVAAHKILESSGWGRVPETEFLCIIKILSGAGKRLRGIL